MEKNSTKSLKWLTGVVVCFGLIALVMIVAQTIGIFFIKSFGQKVVWIEGVEVFQVLIAIFRLLGGIALFASIAGFMLNSIKALNNGVLFPRVNIKLLFLAAGSAFVFLFCNTNVPMILGEEVFQLDFEEILVPAIICTFAILYRKAVQVSEENSLTI